MALTPLHDRVLVRRTEGEEKTAGGLIHPRKRKRKTKRRRSCIYVAQAPVKTAAS